MRPTWRAPAPSWQHRPRWPVRRCACTASHRPSLPRRSRACRCLGHSPPPPGRWTAPLPPARSLVLSARHAPSAPADPPLGSGRRRERSRDHRQSQARRRSRDRIVGWPPDVRRVTRLWSPSSAPRVVSGASSERDCGRGSGANQEGRGRRPPRSAAAADRRVAGERRHRVPGRGRAAPAGSRRGGRARRRHPRAPALAARAGRRSCAGSVRGRRRARRPRRCPPT